MFSTRVSATAAEQSRPSRGSGQALTHEACGNTFHRPSCHDMRLSCPPTLLPHSLRTKLLHVSGVPPQESLCWRLVAIQDCPRGVARRLAPRQHVKQSGFATPAGPHQGGHVAGLEEAGEVVQQGEFFLLGFHSVREVLEGNHHPLKLGHSFTHHAVFPGELRRERRAIQRWDRRPIGGGGAVIANVLELQHLHCHIVPCRRLISHPCPGLPFREE
mmetsp:Transcript_26363/g.74141  ORF Transcript_26363/g.74141 Transcript_26363/m.74141 type:complete len:216 (+) Transcript_26363:1899-2546(+)